MQIRRKIHFLSFAIDTRAIRKMFEMEIGFTCETREISEGLVWSFRHEKGSYGGISLKSIEFPFTAVFSKQKVVLRVSNFVVVATDKCWSLYGGKQVLKESRKICKSNRRQPGDDFD